MPRPAKHTVISKKQIGARLRAARQRKGITQAELAALLGTNQSHVSNVERGDRGITIQQLVRTCRSLRISPEEILGEGKGSTEESLFKDRRLLRRLLQIEKLSKGDRQALLKTIDAFLKSSKVA